jgi:hypothetical protein
MPTSLSGTLRRSIAATQTLILCMIPRQGISVPRCEQLLSH